MGFFNDIFKETTKVVNTATGYVNSIIDPITDILSNQIQKFSPKFRAEIDLNMKGNININLPTDYNINVRFPDLEKLSKSKQDNFDNFNVFNMLATDKFELNELDESLTIVKDILETGHQQDFENKLFFIEVECFLCDDIYASGTLNKDFFENKFRDYINVEIKNINGEFIKNSSFSIFVNSQEINEVTNLTDITYDGFIKGENKNKRYYLKTNSTDNSNSILLNKLSRSRRQIIHFDENAKGNSFNIEINLKSVYHNDEKDPSKEINNYINNYLSRIVISFGKLNKSRYETLSVYDLYNYCGLPHIDSTILKSPIIIKFPIDFKNNKYIEELEKSKQVNNLFGLVDKTLSITQNTNSALINEDFSITDKILNNILNGIEMKNAKIDNIIKINKDLKDIANTYHNGFDVRLRYKVEITNKIRGDGEELPNVTIEHNSEVDAQLINIAGLKLYPHSIYQTVIYPTIGKNMLSVSADRKKGGIIDNSYGFDVRILCGYGSNYNCIAAQSFGGDCEKITLEFIVSDHLA